MKTYAAAFAAAVAAGMLIQGTTSGWGAVPGAVLAPLAAGLAAGAAAFFLFRSKGARCLSRFAPFFPFLAAAAAAAMKVFGRSYRGGVFLPGGVNPMEAVKPLLVFFAAEMAARIRESPSPAKARLQFAGGLAVFAASAAVLNDFGLMAVLGLAAMGIVFLDSAAAGALSAAAGAAGGLLLWMFPPAHVARRIKAWTDPFGDATGAGWQLLKAREVMVAGGVFGAEFGDGGAAACIPVASSDFVYAVVAGEWGLAGCLALLAVYAVFAWAGLWIAAGARDLRSRLAAGGFAVLVAVQVVLNAGGVAGALPMTGLTLPFASRGGSSLAVSVACALAAAGLALAPGEEPPAAEKRVRSGKRRRR